MRDWFKRYLNRNDDPGATPSLTGTPTGATPGAGPTPTPTPDPAQNPTDPTRLGDKENESTRLQRFAEKAYDIFAALDPMSDWKEERAKFRGERGPDAQKQQQQLVQRELDKAEQYFNQPGSKDSSQLGQNAIRGLLHRQEALKLMGESHMGPAGVAKLSGIGPLGTKIAEGFKNLNNAIQSWRQGPGVNPGPTPPANDGPQPPANPPTPGGG